MFPFNNYKKCRVTCIYGKKGNWSSGKHDGVDIVSDGDKTIYAVSEGLVIRSGVNKSWGEYTVIQMKDGRSIVYAHMVSGSRKLKVYQQVKEGDVVGIMGSTGNSTGAHLHIELQQLYYKAGRTGDITQFLGIKNEVGSVKYIKEDDIVDIKSLNVLKDGKVISVESVNVNGTNFIKLRDLNKLNEQWDIGFNGEMPTVNTVKDINFVKYDYTYIQSVGNVKHNIRVWEIDPMLLRADIAKCNLNNINKEFVVNSGYGWWEDTLHKKPYGLSILVSEGKVLCNQVPHELACGCLIVYNDGTVKVKAIKDITKEDNVKFAVGGLTIVPIVDNIAEGFIGKYEDVLRECSRVVMGYNPTKNKVIICGYKKMSAYRGRDLLKELGCNGGITLDGGGSALMREGTEYVLKSDGRTQFGYIYLNM